MLYTIALLPTLDLSFAQAANKVQLLSIRPAKQHSAVLIHGTRCSAEIPLIVVRVPAVYEILVINPEPEIQHTGVV